MTSAERVGPRAAWAEPGPLERFAVDTAAITRAELLKLRHDPVELLGRAVQPLLWLLIFGQVLAASRAIPTGSMPYLDYIAPGILAQSALFTSIFFGLSVIWERDLGLVHKLLASPAARASLVLGKSIAGGVRSLVQAPIVYLAAFLIGVHVQFDPLSLAGVAIVIVLGSALFATFSIVIACVVRTRERFMGIGQLMTMPVFFASSAIYPIALMPPWLQVVSHLNPLTYMVDALRTLMVGGISQFGLPLDFAVLSGVLVALVALASRLYPRLAQ